jgi:hypothetical protein
MIYQIHINGDDNDTHLHINGDEPNGGGKALHWAKVAHYATAPLLALLLLLL